MLKTVMSKLIECLKTHNKCYETNLWDPINEHKMNLLIEILLENRVKPVITVEIPSTKKRMSFEIDDICRLKTSWNYLPYVKVEFNFSNICEDGDEYDCLTMPLDCFNFDWNGTIATYTL